MANTTSSSAGRLEGKAPSARTSAFSITAFVAVERFRLTEPSGRIGHADLQLGPSVLLLSDAFAEYDLQAPQDGQDTATAVPLQVANGALA